MDVLLRRLEELDGAAPPPAEAVGEVKMLWRTLEVLVASLSPREMRPGDKHFAKMLACARQVVDRPARWALDARAVPTGQASSEDRTGVFVFAVRVVAKIAARGKLERDALVSSGMIAAMEQSLATPQRQDAYAVAAVLSVLWAIASDETLRAGLEIAAVILDVMEIHHRDVAIQISGMKLLQVFAKDPRCLDRIPTPRGLQTVLSTTRNYSTDLAVASCGIDITEVIWERSAKSSPGSDATQALVEDMIVTITTVMISHPHLDRIVTPGLKLLRSIIRNADGAKVSLTSTSVWELAGLALDAPSDDAARSFADLLTDILGDSLCIETLRQGRKSARLSLGRLQSRRQILEDKLMAASPTRLKPNDLRAEAVVRALISAVSDTAMIPAQTILTQISTGGDCAENEIGDSGQPSFQIPPITTQIPPLEDSPTETTDKTIDRVGDDRISSNVTLVSPLPSPEPHGFYDKFLVEAEAALSDPAPCDAVSKSPLLLSPCYKQFDNPTPMSRMEFPSIRRIDERLFSKKDIQRRIINDASTTSQWQDRLEIVSSEHESLVESYETLKEKFQVVQRRAEEQSNLLSIQSSRIMHQSQVHQQVVNRIRTLESELLAAKKQYQVEHELRVAEATQSENVSLTLHEANQEIKLLNAQKNSTSRELFEKDRQRIDYQSRASEVKHMKQKLELERDEALVAMQVMRQEKLELIRRLNECRREGVEGLSMREEDVDAVKPRVFSEVLRLASPKNGRLAAPAGGSGNYRSIRIEERLNRSNLVGNSSVFEGLSSLETLAQNDKDDISNPTCINQADIERCLREVFQSMSASVDGNGVHIATVRRFFLESGLAQSPAVSPADVDIILAKVLALTNETQKKMAARKDYGFAQVTPPPRMDARKYRFFDQDSFNEAVTIVGMRRFPRCDLLRVLQNAVALYLLPYRRQYRTRSNSSTSGVAATANATKSIGGSTLHRSISMYVGSPLSTGSVFPTSACASVMRAILTGLALHIGHGNDQQQLSFEGDMSEIRYHSSSNNNNNNRSFGDGSDTGAKRKREDVIYSMLEMHEILSREQKPIVALVEFYGSIHHASAVNELFGLGFDIVLNFAMDFEIIPSFMDRKKIPFVADAETLKKAAFLLVLARLAIELFAAKIDFETPERQITALLQWLDNSVGREKIMRKASLPVVIKFSRKLYTPNA